MKTLRITEILTDDELAALAKLHADCIRSGTTFNKAATKWLESHAHIVERMKKADLFAPYFAYAIEALLPRRS
jgi:ABC-type proline/glycine betaine transport system substrate-binding protein